MRKIKLSTKTGITQALSNYFGDKTAEAQFYLENIVDLNSKSVLNYLNSFEKVNKWHMVYDYHTKDKTSMLLSLKDLYTSNIDFLEIVEEKGE